MAAPRRVSLTNTETGQWYNFQFNPVTATVELEAFYTRLKTPGGSFEELQYSGTGNLKVSFDMNLDGLAPFAPNLKEVENFMWSSLSPPDDVSTVTDGAPSKMLFAWPNWISIVCVLPKLKLVPKRFADDGAPNYHTWSVELEERRSTRIGRDVVRLKGLRRGA